MKRIPPWLTLALGAGVAMSSALGCELIAAIDRTTIATGSGGAGGVGGGGGAGGSTTTGGGQGGQGGGQGTGGSDCSDAMQTGSETDIDCGGGCPACTLGKMCGDASDCESHFCVDGVCCNDACEGSCQACNDASTPGTCGNVAQGTLDAACASPNTTCNATGLCKLPGGVSCGMGSECASGSCNGSGTCTDP
jgi:hypothetical protein